MAQATLTSANVIQAKTGSNPAGPGAVISLDAGTQAGSTVVLEITAGGAVLTDGSTPGVVPDGFCLAAVGNRLGLPFTWTFYKPDVAAGEGVAGSTTWDFNPINNPAWTWRATEWDANLEPVSPLEQVSYGSAGGTGVTTVSTGTTATTSRAVGVALATHIWHRSAVTSQTFDWSDHTGGFAERDELRISIGAVSEEAVSWSWKFLDAAEAVECTATVNTTPRAAGDIYVAMVTVLAATTYAE